MNIKNELLIEPNIKLYNHAEIKLIFDATIKNLNVNFCISKFTTDIFFRVELLHDISDDILNIPYMFNKWVDNHEINFKFEIMNSRVPIVKKTVPHIVELARQNLSKFNFGSHSIDEEIKQSGLEYLLAYAYREKIGISIPDCIVLLFDYTKLQKLIEE